MAETVGRVWRTERRAARRMRACGHGGGGTDRGGSRRRPGRHQFRLPGQEGRGRPAGGLGADARRASGGAAAGGDGGGGAGAGDAEDAHGLGPWQPERAAPGADRAGGRHPHGHRARADAAAVLRGPRGLGLRGAGEAGGLAAGDRQRRHRQRRRRAGGAGGVGGGRGDDRPRLLRPAVAAGAGGGRTRRRGGAGGAGAGGRAGDRARTLPCDAVAFRPPSRPAARAQARVLVLGRAARVGHLPGGDQPGRRGGGGDRDDRGVLRPPDRGGRRGGSRGRVLRTRTWRRDGGDAAGDGEAAPRAGPKLGRAAAAAAAAGGGAAGAGCRGDDGEPADPGAAARPAAPHPLRQRRRRAVLRDVAVAVAAAGAGRPGAARSPVVPAAGAGAAERRHHRRARAGAGGSAAQPAGHHGAGDAGQRRPGVRAADPARRVRGAGARSPAHLPQRRAQRVGDGGDPGARGEEPAVGHPRRGPAAGEHGGGRTTASWPC